MPVTMDEMLFLTRAVAAPPRPLVVGDMPFGSYQVSDEDAVRNAIRFVKEGAPTPSSSRARAVGVARPRDRRRGIPVMGHVGLTPQSATMLGGFKTQGKTREGGAEARGRRARARGRGLLLARLEAVPAPVAGRIPPRSRSRRSASAPARRATARCSSPRPARPDRGPRRRASSSATRTSRRDPRRTRRVRADVRSGAFPEEHHTTRCRRTSWGSSNRASRSGRQAPVARQEPPRARALRANGPMPSRAPRGVETSRRAPKTNPTANHKSTSPPGPRRSHPSGKVAAEHRQAIGQRTNSDSATGAHANATVASAPVIPLTAERVRRSEHEPAGEPERERAQETAADEARPRRRERHEPNRRGACARPT